MARGSTYERQISAPAFSFPILNEHLAQLSLEGCTCDFGHVLSFYPAFFFATPDEKEKLFGEQEETHSECMWLLWEQQTEIFL